MADKERKLTLQEYFPPHGFKDNGDRNYIIFSAQNNTDVSAPFLNAIKHFSKLNYQPICIPLVYQTITPFSNEEERDVRWDARLAEYMISETLNLSDDCAVFPAIRPSATTLNPLRGLINRSTKTMIVGANRQHVESIASPRGHKPTYLLSTGSVTVPNFRPGLAGAKALPGHELGALVVEVDGNRTFWRHITFRDGCFYDLDVKVTAEGVTHRHCIDAIVWGDFHAEDHQPFVWEASMEMNQELSPRYNVLHDLVTFKNGHHQTFVDRINYCHRNTDRGFKIAAGYLKELHKLCPLAQTVVVNSNHDNHLDGWLQRYNHKEWPGDALFYHKLMVNILEGGDRDPFYYAMKMFCPKTVFNAIQWLGKAESFIVSNYELGHHGHAAPGGGRGSAASLAKTTHRQIIGHSHTIKRNDTVIQAGTSGPVDESFHQSYGACSNAHVLLYPNGTVTHVVIHLDGQWRGL